jgi:hypothetical protein
MPNPSTMTTAKLSETQREEAWSIARRLPFSQEEWLARHDPADPEWCPARMTIAFLRMGLISPDEVEGGYLLTPLGLAVRSHLKDQANEPR